MNVVQLLEKIPLLPLTDPNEKLRRYFRSNFPSIYRKVALQVRRTPRRQTGAYQNRHARWKLDPGHPDYTEADKIPLIEALCPNSRI